MLICGKFLLQTHDSREVFEQQMPLCNDKLIANPNIKTQLSGSTAITALLQNNALLTVANVGDSRCLLGRADGEEVEALAMNTDHTPNVPDEAARITSCKVCPVLHSHFNDNDFTLLRITLDEEPYLTLDLF